MDLIFGLNSFLHDKAHFCCHILNFWLGIEKEELHFLLNLNQIQKEQPGCLFKFV